MNTQKRIATLVVASMLLSTATTFSINIARFKPAANNFTQGFKFGAKENFAMYTYGIHRYWQFMKLAKSEDLKRGAIPKVEKVGRFCGRTIVNVGAYAAVPTAIIVSLVSGMIGYDYAKDFYKKLTTKKTSA